MPNYFAHTHFGALVLNRLPSSLQSQIKNEEAAYWIGQYGPDPLFFHHILRSSEVSAFGHALHNRPAKEVLEILRSSAQERRPFAFGYSAGFFCHFALDSRFHPLINSLLKTSHITHTGFEAELDRMILEERITAGLEKIPLPSLEDLPDTFYQTILNSAYLGVSQKDFQKSFQNFRLISRAYIRLVSSPLQKCLSHGDCNHYRAQMSQLLYDTVDETVVQLISFFEGTPLDSWYDRDFCNGQSSESAVSFLAS